MTIHVQIAHSKLFALKKQQLSEVAKLAIVHVQQPRKKSPHVLITMQLLVFGCHKPIQKQQKHFLENLVFHICKGYMPLFSCENVWFQRLVLPQRSHVQFPSRSSFVEEMLATMVKKIMDQYFVPNLASTIVVSTSFDMWMSQDGVDTFSFVINFLNET
jgi:hypothetical protein